MSVGYVHTIMKKLFFISETFALSDFVLGYGSNKKHHDTYNIEKCYATVLAL